MSGVDGQRSEDREDFAGEDLAQVLLLGFGQVLEPAAEDDSLLLQGRQDFLFEDPVLFLDELGDEGGDAVDLVLREHLVGPGGPGDAGVDLLHQAADPDHEELVQVGGEDGEELEPLEQGDAVVLGLVEDAAVELQPGEFAVDVQGRVVQGSDRAAGAACDMGRSIRRRSE